jgi:hypothetical protein
LDVIDNIFDVINNLMENKYNDWPKCQLRCDVDNHLGYLYNRVYITLTPEQLNFKPLDETFPDVLVMNDVVDLELAKTVREFVFKIPFDNTLKQINDTDNQPKNTCYIDAGKAEFVKEAFVKVEHDPTQWHWEKYSYCIWRAAPLTLKAFINSPIFQLINVLEKKWKGGSLDNLDIYKLQMATWVIQRVDNGQDIGAHRDDCDGRVISFLYYITPDDWDYVKDGGDLWVSHDGVQQTSINPTFNSMVAWNMSDKQSPLHGVHTVIAASDRPRIALVGFFNK